VVIGEKADFALQVCDPVPRLLSSRATLQHSGMDLREVDSAEQRAVQYGNDNLGSRLVKEHG
jgi:hypothetical protein